VVVKDFAFKGAPARLAGALLRLAETTPDQEVNASHHELADMIAAYCEMVTLALDEFQTRGVVKLGRRSIEILDRRSKARGGLNGSLPPDGWVGANLFVKPNASRRGRGRA